MSSDAPDVNRSSRQSISTLPHPLSASPTIFQELVASTCSSTGLDLEKIVHDYWLIRSLYGVAARLPEGGVFKDPLTPKDIRKGRTQETQPVKGVWAFGGGTCLSSAWQVSPRWSEDIDGVILQSDTASKSSFNGIRKQVTDLVAEVVGVKGTTITRTDPIIHTRFEVSEEVSHSPSSGSRRPMPRKGCRLVGAYEQGGQYGRVSTGWRIRHQPDFRVRFTCTGNSLCCL